MAVELFLARRIPFTAIPALIEGVLDAHRPGDARDVEAIVAADAWARTECERLAKPYTGEV